MTSSDQLDQELMRIRVALLVMVGALVFLGAVLWRVQVFSTSDYRDSLDRQSIRRVRLPAARGAILERNGVCLAQNRPSYNIAIYVEELRQPGKMSNTVDEVERVIRKVGGIIGTKPQVARDDILMHIKKRLPLPFLAWRDIDQKILARWCESHVALPGVDIYIEPVRSYPMGPLAAHVLGYVGRADPANDSEEEESYHYYLPEMEGCYGVEKTFNGMLSGEAGGEAIRVDASGFKHEGMKGKEAIPGQDVVLTMDFRIQRLVEEALGEDRGAAVVVDPRNGDVLAMASSPTFDPNRFGAGMSREEWMELNDNENRPMLNRAIQGIYPPGSTFKPIVVLAALEGGTATADVRFNCPGYFQLGAVRFHCWQKEGGHGTIAMRKGIEQSCNAYFCQLGLQCGHERIVQMARALGLGARTGIDLGAESGLESAGIVPDHAWKRKYLHDGWRPGDTCNLSIGQGALAVTPLQMAVVTMAIANGGNVYRPRLLLTAGDKGILVRKLRWAEPSLRVVREGMRDVVQAETGTGKRAQIPGVEMAGKTGTAEFGLKVERKKYTWMTVFAPIENPRYVVAMVIEEGVSGGFTVAPRIGKLMAGVFRLEGANTAQKTGTEG
jgi:penicillin-binding protein 2